MATWYWSQGFQGKESTAKMPAITTEVKGTEMNTCLGYTESQRSRVDTHNGLWYGDTAQCCAHTVDKTGCSGAHRIPENRLQCGQTVEEIGWQGRDRRTTLSASDQRLDTKRTKVKENEWESETCNLPLIEFEKCSCKIVNAIPEVCF